MIQQISSRRASEVDVIYFCFVNIEKEKTAQEIERL